MMDQMLLQVLMGSLGSLGYAVLFNVRRSALLFSVLGGALGWAVYLLTGGVYPDDLANYLYAAMAVTLYAEVLARVKKTPVTVFLVTSIIPLIPGGSLYYTMASCLREDIADFSTRGIYTISIAAMIALGIMAVMMLMHVYLSIRCSIRARRRRMSDGRDMPR